MSDLDRLLARADRVINDHQAPRYSTLCAVIHRLARELHIRVAADRALLISTAAAVFPSATDAFDKRLEDACAAERAVRIARMIIAAVDQEEQPPPTQG